MTVGTYYLSPEGFAIVKERSAQLRADAAIKRAQRSAPERRLSDRRVSIDRRGAKTVIDTDGTVVVRPADPNSSGWVPL